MNEQPLDLRRMIRAVSKRWLLILVLGWTGCVAGYVAGSRRAPVYVATSSVLLPLSPVDAQGNRTRNINTQVNIASNGNILQRAGQAVNPPVGVRRMRTLIKVKALTADILEVRAQASSGRDAAVLADAVAKEYVAEATAGSSRLAGTAISGLEAQVAKVKARLQQTKVDIDTATVRLNSLPPSTPERLRQLAVIDSLQQEQVEAAQQLDILEDRIADARLEDELRREGTRLLAPAIIPAAPPRPVSLLLTIGGGLAGLLGGVLVALVLERRDGRLRSRSEIAGVVAAPVLASLVTPHRLSARVCRSMLQRWEPQPTQSWVLRQACERLGVLHGARASHLVVVGLPGDAAGPMVAVQVAVFAASTGTDTALVVASPHPTCAHLRSACHRGEMGSQIRPHLVTLTDPLGPEGEEEDGRRPELTISFAMAEPGELLSLPRGAIATLALSSGFATADTLAMAALVCLDASLPLCGIFLANPDPSDPTTGALANGSIGLGIGTGPIPLEDKIEVVEQEPGGRGELWAVLDEDTFGEADGGDDHGGAGGIPFEDGFVEVVEQEPGGGGELAVGPDEDTSGDAADGDDHGGNGTAPGLRSVDQPL